ncbi:MAG: riboflavin synthase [Candidatus Omnitrophica bacterium]|nr:riboflavin synthase [Candidatus Omnitrophota bacterium]
MGVEMFTGIVKEIGKVRKVASRGDFYRLEVGCGEVSREVDTGDSVAVNGVCLSVVGAGPSFLAFDVVKNTYRRTNLKRLKTGSRVNLENALKAGDDISGHIVTGHVDGERAISSSRKTTGGLALDIKLLPDDSRYLVDKGSVAIDGVSLTVGELFPGILRVFIIPHTWENTSLKFRRPGAPVNLEFDAMGKYARKDTSEAGLDRTTLMRNGFI